MARYLAIIPQGDPSDQMGPDEQGRAQVVFNVLALKRPSATFVDELLEILEDAGVGTKGVDLWGGSLVGIPGPEDLGPFLVVRSAPGVAPTGTHDDPAGLRQPGAQVVVHAAAPSAAEAMAEAALVAFRNVVNQDVEIPT